MAFVENLAPMLADFGEPVVLAGASVRAIFDTQAVDPITGAVTLEPSVLLRAASAPAAAVGQTMVRNTATGAVSYTVRQVLQEPPDGALLRLVLARS